MNTLLLLAACLTLQLSPHHVSRVVDGDTFLLYNVGIPSEESVRVVGVNTPERGQPGFFEARNFTLHWLSLSHFTFTSCRRDSFGRYLATVSRNGVTLSDALIANGHGTRP